MKLQFLHITAWCTVLLGLVATARLAPAAEPAPAPAPAKPAALPEPTLQDLHEMYDAKQFTTCVQQIARALRNKQNDKFALQLLRGNCLLHLNDRASAITAYQAAAKSPDPKVSVPARASELLARASDKMIYKPKSAAGSEPINILNDDSRHKAMAAMFEDQLADTSAAIRQAKSAEDLAPIIEVAPKVLDLYALEVTGTGVVDRMRPDMTAIGQRARTLIEREVSLVEQHVAGVERQADQMVDPGIGRPGGSQWWLSAGVVRKGLTSNDRKALQDTIDYLEKIQQTAQRGQQIARQVEGNFEAWDALIEKVARTTVYAENVLEAE